MSDQPINSFVRTVSGVSPVHKHTLAWYALTLFSIGGAHLQSAAATVRPR